MRCVLHVYISSYFLRFQLESCGDVLATELIIFTTARKIN